MSWQSQVIALLAASLVRPFILAAAAVLFVFIFRVRHPASRHAVWTAVLIGMLLLPFVSVFAPRWNLPVLPREQVSAVNPLPPAAAPGAAASSAALPLLDRTTSAFEATPGRFSNTDLVLWCYLAGLLTMTAYRVMGWALLRRLLSRSTRLRQGPLRESADLVAPVAVGVLRPSVILPIAWRQWSSNTRRAVLAHEFAHVRRRDTLVLALARFGKCILWFHPLAWWVSRRLSNLAELACDAAALQKVNDPAGYTRVLIEFSGLANRAGHRVAIPGLAMAAGSHMGKRIDQVFELSSGNFRKLTRPAVVLAMTGVPILCVAATLSLQESPSRPLDVPSISPTWQRPSPAPVQVAQNRNPVPTQPPTTRRPATPTPPNSAAREDKPIALGLVIDNSGSMRDKRAKATAASMALVNTFGPQDEMFVVNFNDESFLDQQSTNDKQKLEAAIRKAESRGGSAMRDALSSSIDYSKSAKNETKTLVVITDGDDNTSRHSLQELVKSAQDSGIAIYTIGLLSDDEPDKRRIAQRALAALAEETGGMEFYPKDQVELDQALVKLERQIRNRTSQRN